MSKRKFMDAAGEDMVVMPQCRINHGDDGARARGPPAEGAPEQNSFFLRQRELVVGCIAPHGTCLS